MDDELEVPDDGPVPGDVAGSTNVRGFREEDVDDLRSTGIEDDEKRIRLKRSIRMEDVMSSNGVIIDPELDSSLLSGHGTEAEHEEEKYRMDFMSKEVEPENFKKLYEFSSPCGKSFADRALLMHNLTEDGFVKKRVCRSGLLMDGVVPLKASITIHYSLYLEGQDGPFDSTVIRGRPVRFRLDEDVFYPGLFIAIKSMRKKERSEFLIEPLYAFGERGCPPRIPGNAQILADVEMLDFAKESETEAIMQLPVDQRNELYPFAKIEEVALHENKTGHKQCARAEWKIAARHFEMGSRLLEDVSLENGEQEERQKVLLMRLYMNRGHCYLKFEPPVPKRACIVLAKALEIDGKNVKALFRMGSAKEKLFNFSEAESYYKRALALEPNNCEVGKALTRLGSQMRTEKKNEKELFSRMLGVKDK